MIEECNLAYIKKLVLFFFKSNLKDLFLALLLFEIYEPSDYVDIKKLKNADMKELIEKYREYIKGKEPLINPRWLDGK